jgi:hypothetical protein
MSRHRGTFTNSIASTVEEQAIFRVAKGKHMEIVVNSDGRRFGIHGVDGVRLTVRAPNVRVASHPRGELRYDQWTVSRQGCATGQRWVAAYRGRLPW